MGIPMLLDTFSYITVMHTEEQRLRDTVERHATAAR
jgi:hypothetical protein